MELVEQLREDGIIKGLCSQWQKKLTGNLSIKRLIELYIRGIDFCIKNNYPTLEFIRANFKGKCEPYGVYVDGEVHLRNKERLVIQGNSSGELEYSGFSVSRVFLRHNSDVTINVSGNAVLTIDMFDNSHVRLNVTGTRAAVYVSAYGRSQVEHTGNVKITRKYKDTY